MDKQEIITKIIKKKQMVSPLSLSNKDLLKKIIQKKEFSEIPLEDVEKAFSKFDKELYCDEEKIKKTRDLLRLAYSSCVSGKLLSKKDKEAEWLLRKHLSTRERVPYYKEVYSKCLGGFEKCSVIDLGAGINGISYNYFLEAGKEVDYVAVEAVGQLVSLMNDYFKCERISARAIHGSLFELEKIKKIVEETKKPRIVFLFKVLDALESLEWNYSKKLLLELKDCERIVVSFATKSMIKRENFKVKRYWFENFARENFNVREFLIGNEKYFILERKED